MSAEIGNLEENPENEGGGEHGDEGGKSDLVENSARDVKSASNKAEKEVLDGKIEGHGHSREYC